MPELHVYLAEGFRDDRVLVRANGREVYRKDSVTTKALVSLADEFSVPASGGTLEIEIELPSRGLRERIEFDLDAGQYLALSIEDGRITHFLSPTPLGFH